MFFWYSNSISSHVVVLLEKKTIKNFGKNTFAGTCRSNLISSEMPGSQKFSTLLKNYVKQSFSSDKKCIQAYKIIKILAAPMPGSKLYLKYTRINAK